MALPDTKTFAEQTADHLRVRILAGHWPGALPPERELAQHLQVARNTLRKAIRILEGEGLVFVPHGRREHRIRLPEQGAPGSPAALPSRVVLLTHAPLYELPSHSLLRVDLLRRAVGDIGIEFRVLTSRAFRLDRPAAALQELTRDHPDSLWVLHHSTQAIQQWFEKDDVPSVIFGDRYPGVTLPALSLNLGASMRHAMGMLRRRGHTRLGLVESQRPLAGHLEVRAVMHRHATQWNSVCSLVCGGHPAGFASAVKHMMASPERPSAFIVLTPPHLLSLYSTCCHLGLRIPYDVSVLALFDSPILADFVPSVAHYRENAEVEVKRLVSRIRRILHGNPSTLSSTRLLQEYVPGGSLAAAAS